MRVGLTGGVGSGKSTVAEQLQRLGAVVIDADVLAREVVEPGTPGFDSVVATFGSQVVSASGSLDRAKLAELVFSDAAARTALNEIVHPLVGARVSELASTARPDDIVVYDVPLLVEAGMADGFDVVVVVEADPETRLARLADRGMPEPDARARMASQATDAQRRAVADELISNDGALADLESQVEQVWGRLVSRRDAAAEANG